MALRIRDDGRILCAAMHPPAPGDTYLHDGLHSRLSSDLSAIVTEPMHCGGGRGGHADHGEWWLRDSIPTDVDVDPFYMERGLAKRRAMRAERVTARARNFVVGLDVVALGALVVVVMFVRARQLGMKRRDDCHISPPLLKDRR